MNELLLLLQALQSDDQLAGTQTSLDTFNTAAAQTVDLLTQLRDRANQAAEALSRVIAAQSKIQGRAPTCCLSMPAKVRRADLAASGWANR